MRDGLIARPGASCSFMKLCWAVYDRPVSLSRFGELDFTLWDFADERTG